MAWTDLKAAVAAVIKTNGNQEITGSLLQSTLNSIIDQVGANASYKGVAIPSTSPGSPDGPVFYIASTQGTYANFGGFVLDGGFAVLSNVSGSWTGTKFLNTEIVGELGDSETKVVNQKIATDTINLYNVTKLHPLGSGQYYTLSTAIFKIPKTARKSGMIVTYESSNRIWELKRFIGNAYTEWSHTESKWIDLNTNKKSVGYIVAAFDSSAEEKKCADFIAHTEVNGFTQINAAISALGASGGTVVLMNGTYSSSADEGISIHKANVTIEGQGYGTFIKRGGGGTGAAIITQSGGNNLIVRNLSVNTFVNCTNGGVSGGFVENIIENTTVVIRRPETPTPYILAKQINGINGINAAIALLPSNGGKIVLEKGIYTGANGVNLNKDNIIIEGQGRSTEIKRDGSGVNDVFNNSNKRGCVLKDLSLTRITRPSFPSDFDTVLKNTWLNGKYLDESQQSIVNVITVGKNQQYEKLSDAYNSIDTTRPLPSSINKYEIHVYGKILEESTQIRLHKRYVDLVGHNATIELYNTSPVCGISIVDNRDTVPQLSANYGEINDSTYKDLHFLRSGEIDGMNFPCASISSANINLINCTFENITTSTHEYDPSIPVGHDDPHGARRHGVVIDIPRYERECNTRLINCKGIGSPAGFQNTRGIYIIGGSPKLYNCIGVAGGLGERSHGIICHRYSNPILYNCIGYGSIYSDRQSNGIQCQSMANPIMHNCIGFAGSPNDSAGICTWNRSQPKLFNCIGFSGQGENSVGLEVADKAKPFVKGGFYGVEDKSFVVDFIKDSGQNYQTFKPTHGIPYTVSNVVLWLVSPSILPTGTTFSLETVEDIPRVIVDKALCDNTLSAMIFPVMVKTSVDSDVLLKVVFKDTSENIISVPDSVIKTQIGYNYNSSGGHGILIKSNSSPEILDAVFESNENSDCLSIKTYAKNYNFDRCTLKSRNEDNNAISALSELTNVPIFNSKIQGLLSNIVSFKEATTVLDSSNYSI